MSPRLVVSLEDREGTAALLDEPLPGAEAPPGEWQFQGAGFEMVVRHASIDAGGRAFVVDLTRTAPSPHEAAIRLGVRLGPTTDPWLLVPGVLYGENRPAGSTLPYPAWRLDPDADDPWASDRWVVRADRAATPMALVSDGTETFAIATRETGELGIHGLEVAATHEATEVAVWAPFQERPVRYDGSPHPRPPVVQRHRWEPGETRTIEARVFVGPPGRQAFAPVLRALDPWLAAGSADGPGAGAGDGAAHVPATPWASLEDAAVLAAEGLRRWHWRPEDSVLLETAGFERGPGDPPPGEVPGDRLAMHVAWLSGAPAAAALLAHGRRTSEAESVAIGARVLDGICDNLAPAGTFWGQWTASHGWTKGWTPGEDRLHARTLAEAALFTVRALAGERVLGVDHPSWTAAATSTLLFAASRAREDGALGSAYHGRTGAVESWAGSAGLAWVPALVEGATVLGEPAWIDVARAAGAHYASFVDRAFLHGAPEDVELAPTSEDGYVAVLAYVALARAATNRADRARWLDLAVRSAEWTLTFRYAYDVRFPPRSLLARHGYRSRGMDQASVANQHLHVYGLICVPELAWLGRDTDDPWLVARARDHLVAARQLLVREDGVLNGRRGMLPERIYQTDCFGPKGGVGMLSHAWCLGLLLGACEAARGIGDLAEPAAAGEAQPSGDASRVS
jgi:hypothetical protein